MMILADSYLHTLDPFAIRFTETFGVRWYGVSYAIGFLIGWWMIRSVAKRSWSPLPAEKVGDLMFAAILGVLLGGRLGYAIFYEPHLFWGLSKSFPFWDLLAINKGGMASHGGMVGVILGCSWFGLRNKISALHMIDLGAMAATPGLFLGRIANFINAELWGKALPASMQGNAPWWSVKYPQEIIERWVPDGDARLAQLDPLQTVVGMDEHFYANVVQAARAGNETVIHTIKPLLTAYYPSQIFQAITDGPILLSVLVLIWLKPRKPGVVGSWFLIIYGIMRIATEVFRQPDEGVELTFGVLSRGQTLSLLMSIAGVVCLWIACRRKAERLGGLPAK